MFKYFSKNNCPNTKIPRDVKQELKTLGDTTLFVGGNSYKQISKTIGSGGSTFGKFSKFQKVEIWKKNIC